LVLIHAPLYYRAAALLARPMWRAGLHPVGAARAAGRLISALCLAATLAAAYRLGRLGGLPCRSGLWSALLVAGSSVLSGQPFAVRPDMAGVVLQTWGAALALGSLAARGDNPGRGLGWASVLFGLATCTKQHLVGAWAVSVVLAVAGWFRGRLGLGAVARVVLPGVVVAGVIYGEEWVATGGRVWDAAFVAAAHVGRVHPGDRNRVLVLFMALVNRSAGTVTLLAAAALILAGSRPGVLGRLLAGVGTVGIGLVLACLVADVIVGIGWTGAFAFLALCLAAALALPAALLSMRPSSPAKAVDVALWAYFTAELGLAVLLFWMSTGAWLNYAIPTAIFAAALAARALSRAVASEPPPPMMVSAALASLATLVSSLSGLNEDWWVRYIENHKIQLLYKNVNIDRSYYFFGDRPGQNRLNGRLELVYDDWLYPVFESLRLAEPRSRWLGRALVAGSVRVVVTTSERPVIDGTMLDLRRLGYRPDVKLEPFFVWRR
jgi:hypothetical protein